MKNFSMTTLLKPIVFAVSAATLIASHPMTAQKLQSRITGLIDNTSRATLVGSRPSRSYLGVDMGAADPGLPLHSITLDFSRTPAQQAELDALIAAQQNPSSPLYQQWLSPEQFGQRFGVSATDIQTVTAWLQHEGFTIDSVARGSNHISFSGNAALVESAFGAPIHTFKSHDGSLHFAPAHDLTIPAALASSVQSIRNVSNYLPHPHYMKPRIPHIATPRWTNISDPYTPYELGPQDIATLYDVNNAYKAGYTGAGQSIAIVGQSYILPSDVSTFQTLAGVPTAKPPVFVLVPGTGTPARFAGDESESDLDVEYSSTIGKGAQVYFVYTGSYETGVDQSIEYAIDEKIAPIISSSYGECEVDQAEGTTSAATEIADFDAILAQGVAQGQTFLVASGDDGAVDCIEDGDAPATAQSAAVDYPASSPYAVAMGGTELPAASYTTNASTYWLNNAAGSSPLVNSLIKNPGEVVWNDDDPIDGTSAGGGGISLYEQAPTWQTPGAANSIGGVLFPTEPTISIGSGRTKSNVEPRLVPDISLYASPNDPGMLVCSSDSSAWYTGQSGSCTNGFYDSTGTYLTIFGGTSFDGPIFAGMLAILNQAVNATGQGNVNSTLYSIATSSTANYASAFHDITSGSNACYDFYETESGYPAPPAPMPGICGVGVATNEFSATTGYDLASGLGSIDLNNLIAAWPKTAASALIGTTNTLTPASATPASGATDAVTITVASQTGSTVPAGTVSISVDNVVVSSSVPLTAGVGTYNFSSNVLGTHIISAYYAGDTTHAASSGTLSVYVGTTTPSFTITASPVTLTAGTTGNSTVTIAPMNGYTGLISFTFTAPSSLTNACAVVTSTPVTSTSLVNTPVTIYTNINNCPSSAVTLARNSIPERIIGPIPVPSGSHSRRNSTELATAAVGLLLAFSLRRRSRLLRVGLSLAVLCMLSLAGLGLTGCVPAPTVTNKTSSSTTSTSYTSAPGTYTLTLSASDSLNPTLTTSTTFTLTVQ